MLAGGVGLVALASLCFPSCKHSQEVLDLEKAAKSMGGNLAAAGNGGVFPPVDLTPVVTDIGPETFTGAPVADEENRESCPTDTPSGDFYIPDPAVQTEAQTLLGQMTIEQKVIQVTGIIPNYSDSNRWDDIQRSRDIEELNLRGYLYRDGPHGLNLEAGQGRDALPGNYSTSFPTSVVMGASFDMELMYRVGRAIGDEVAASGNNASMSPCMNILRHPYWGRAQETFGEDVFHLGRTATEFTKGLQEYVVGCAKHYVANNIESKRFSDDAVMDEQTLREIYGRHFEMVVRDGGVGCIMASYNAVNGTKSTQNKHTLTDMLRTDMGFKGFVITDWWAMPAPKTGQGPVESPQDKIVAAEALNAGLDLEVPWALNYATIPSIATDGTVPMSLVDAAVLRILEQKLRFHTAYMDGPIAPNVPTTTYDAAAGSIGNNAKHLEISQELAEKGAVLLKNDGALPIAGVAKVAVIGASLEYTVKSDNPKTKVFNFATDAALGDRGSSRVRPDPATTVGPLAGIQAAAPAGVQVVGGTTAADVGDADFVVLIVGNTAGEEGEEYTGASDRESMDLRVEHTTLANSVLALGKKTVVIVESGGVVNMPWIGSVNAAVMAWYPGQRGGAALGRLLFGAANFSGRLPVTWPASDAQLPVFNEGVATTMDYYLGYRRFDKDGLVPLYAFGHGLSYSTFRYERIHMPCKDVTKQGVFNVEVDVRNVAGPAGDEIVQVYASYPATQVRRSVKELKGFARVHLEPGAGKRVSIPIRVQDLKYWDTPSNAWAVEAGPVTIQVGPSSDNLPLTQTITFN